MIGRDSRIFVRLCHDPFDPLGVHRTRNYSHNPANSLSNTVECVARIDDSSPGHLGNEFQTALDQPPGVTAWYCYTAGGVNYCSSREIAELTPFQYDRAGRTSPRSA